ncbi:MAG: radical SAM protein [Fimbriimonadales bacterium]
MPTAPDRLGPATIGLRPRSKVLSVAKGMIADAFDYSLNPYVGCGFACSYCYAANFVADEQRKADWGKWVDIKIDAVEQIARADLRGKRIFMSSATDPYQPLEQRVRLTRRILEVLVPMQPVLSVQTRSPLVTRDLDLLARLDQVRVNMSITTDSEEVRKRFEPSCASIDRRFEALGEVSAAGIPLNVCISPMLPIESPRRFAERILSVTPARVYAGFFHSSGRQFAAATRPEAFVLMKQLGWTREDYLRTLRELCRYLPMLKPWDTAEVSMRPLRKSA